MPAPWMAGVCSGLAVHLGVPVMVIRGGLIALTFLGVGAVAYLWLWVTAVSYTHLTLPTIA